MIMQLLDMTVNKNNQITLYCVGTSERINNRLGIKNARS